MSPSLCEELFDVVDFSMLEIEFRAELSEEQQEKIAQWIRGALKTVRVPLEPIADIAILLSTPAKIVIYRNVAERLRAIIDMGWKPEDATVSVTMWGAFELKLPNGTILHISTDKKTLNELSREEYRRYTETLRRLERFKELCKKIAEYEKELSKIRAEMLECNREKSEMKKRIETLERLRDELLAENKTLMKELWRLQDEKRALEERVKELEETLRLYSEDSEDEADNETTEEENVVAEEEAEEDADP